MNPLTQIPAAYRKFVYAAYALVGLVFGALQVAYLPGTPHWLQVAWAVYGFVGTACGLTAHVNVPAAPRRRKGAAGAVDVVTVLVVVLLVVVLLVVLGVVR